MEFRFNFFIKVSWSCHILKFEVFPYRGINVVRFCNISSICATLHISMISHIHSSSMFLVKTWCAILFMSDEYYQNLKVYLGYIYLYCRHLYFFEGPKLGTWGGVMNVGWSYC